MAQRLDTAALERAVAAPTDAVQVQVMTQEQAEAFPFNPFDLTQVWPHADFPPISCKTSMEITHRGAR